MDRINTPTPRKPHINLNLPKIETTIDDGVSCITARVNENVKRSISISNDVIIIPEEDAQQNLMNDQFDKEYIKIKKNLCQLLQQIRFPSLPDLESYNNE